MLAPVIAAASAPSAGWLTSAWTALLANWGCSILQSVFGSSPGFQGDGQGGRPVSYSPRRIASIPSTARATRSAGRIGSAARKKPSAS
jgi:hypothetical protein